MNLKEAFRYQNFLDKHLNEALSYLQYTPNVTSVKQEHRRKKACTDAENETVTLDTERTIQMPVNSIISFVVSLLEEKTTLSEAIQKAKAACKVDIDSSIAMNKQRQNISRVFSVMGSIKAQERTLQGTALKFNNDGNQIQYRYDIQEVSTIDFDRNVVKAKAKALLSECDIISNCIDKIMIDTVVEYDTPYDVNDSFTDVLDTFVNK